MNHLILMGRLVKDPDVSYANSGTTIGRFTIAVDRRFKREGQPEADFFNCTTFGKQAEFVEKYLKKGTKIILSGEIQNNNYKDRNGNQQYSVQIMVNELEFAESKKTQTENNVEANNGFINVPEGLEEELPFN